MKRFQKRNSCEGSLLIGLMKRRSELLRELDRNDWSKRKELKERLDYIQQEIYFLQDFLMEKEGVENICL